MTVSKEQLEQLRKTRAPITRTPYATSAYPPSKKEMDKFRESESLEGRTVSNDR